MIYNIETLLGQTIFVHTVGIETDPDGRSSLNRTFGGNVGKVIVNPVKDDYYAYAIQFSCIGNSYLCHGEEIKYFTPENPEMFL